MLMRIKHHTPNFTFISDSIFKFLSKDKMSLQYIMQNDHKCNIRLFRGYSASQVVQEVTDNMSHMPQSGITAMVSTFGTVDLTHTSGAQVEIAHTHTHTHTLIGSVIKLSEYATQCSVKFQYIILGYIASIPDKSSMPFLYCNLLASNNIPAFQLLTTRHDAS